MKRSRNEQEIRSLGHVAAVKRPKSNQACASCRRHKTRCEQLEGEAPLLRCHRCNVLNMLCSFESLPAPNITAPLPRPPNQDPELVAVSALQREASPLPFSRKTPDSTLTPWSFLENPPTLGLNIKPVLRLQELMRQGPHKNDFEPYPSLQSAPNHHQIKYILDAFNMRYAPLLNLPDSQPDLPTPILDLTQNVLNRVQIKYLLDMFNIRYAPWLNLPDSQPGPPTPLFDLARCSVASQHLDAPTRSILVPRLRETMRDAILKHMFISATSTDVIQAILVSIVWSQDDTVEARLFAGPAINIAVDLQLGQASERAINLQKLKKKDQGLSKEQSKELAEATNLARLWITLTNAESLLCLGTGRAPLSRRSIADRNVLDIHSLSTATHARDVRLGLMSQLLDLAECGLSIRLAGRSDLDRWHKEVLEVLVRMDSLHRLMTPLSASEPEVFYFHMLLVYYYSCRLLVLHQALREARREFTCHDPDVPWYSRFIHNGVNLAGAWGYEAIMSAESVLSVLISRSELALIGTLPDMVFTFISFAAVFLIMAKFALYEHRAESISGSGDALLVKTIERLSEAAYSPEHHAARCARIIASSLAAWEMRKAKPEIGKYIRVAPTVAKSPVPEPAGETTTFTNGSADPIQDFNRFMNPDIFLDSDFWASFMNNLSSGSSEDFGLPRI